MSFGIGFVTGRPNVCKVINNYYKNMLEQFEKSGKQVNLTIFLLYDLNYQYTIRTDFYSIIPEVYKNIKIKYITPENIEEEKKKLISRHNFTREEVDLFLGNGHAKGRNTVMYYALKWKMDYLLFWDDDEYPAAVVKDNDNLSWIPQDNLLKHLENIDNADVTIGYHCGYISPIPYVELDEEISEEDFKNYIEAISNEIVSWESIKQKMIDNNGVTYADKNIAEGNGLYELQDKWVAGSTLCLNLDHINRIPAFYNPPQARGEDTFFSTLLKDAKIIIIPVYHFHDGFLKYTSIIKGKYPKKLRRIKVEEDDIESRFLKASKGWIKYKPLLMYIQNKENYKDNMQIAIEKLEKSVPKINELFQSSNFSDLVKDLKEYDKNVEKHYEEYLKTNEIWNRLKQIIEAKKCI